MKSEDLERLSRWVDGDLPASEAAEVQAAIASDPEWARAWDTMRQLGPELQQLPELSPPAELDRRVLGSGAEGVRATGWGWAGWALAAAALLVALAGWVREPAQLILTDGSQFVDGHVVVIAGDQVVEVDGAAQISVEPPRPDLRVVGVQTEDAMQKRDVLVGALAGAVVTVAVMEGSARIWPASPGGGEPVAVAAGESRTVGIRRTPDGVELEVGHPPQGETPEQAVARLTAERDALAEELAASRFEGAMAKGQLAVHQGEPIPWDDGIPAAFRPEAVEAALGEFLEQHPEVELADLDCAEFPCIATFRPLGGDGDPMAAAREIPRQYAESLFGDGAAVMASMMAHAGDDGAEDHLLSVAAVPEERRDGEWATRAQYRTEGISEALVGQGGDGSGPGRATEDVDIH